MNGAVTDNYLMHMLNPLFPRVDQMLRRGAHLGEEDQDCLEFIRDAEEFLQFYYGRYDAQLVCTSEGSYYLIAEESGYFKTRALRRLDMIIGKTLAGMMLDPEILTTLGRISLEKLLNTLEIHPGRADLLLYAGIRGGDEEIANRKLREAIGKSLNTLDDLRMIRWNARGEEILPFKAVMRFADDVRGEGSIEENLAQQLASGAVVIGNEAVSYIGDVTDVADGVQHSSQPGVEFGEEAEDENE